MLKNAHHKPGEKYALNHFHKLVKILIIFSRFSPHSLSTSKGAPFAICLKKWHNSSPIISLYEQYDLPEGFQAEWYTIFLIDDDNPYLQNDADKRVF